MNIDNLDFLRIHKSEYERAVRDISRAAMSVQIGVDPEDVKFDIPSTNQTVTGSQGQTRPQGLLNENTPTDEQLAAARVNNSISNEEFKSEEDVFNRLSSIASLSQRDRMQASIDRYQKSYGLTKTLAGIDPGDSIILSEGRIAEQIKSNIDNLSKEELARLFFSEGQIVDKIASSRRIPDKFEDPEGGSSNQDKIKRAKLLKRFAKENKIKPGDSIEDLKLAFSEALAEQISKDSK